jgi:membrane protease YdiL (CAAX protease family)
MKLAISPRWTDPYFIAASSLYVLALLGLALSSNSWWSALVLGIGVLILSQVVLAVTGKQASSPEINLYPPAQLGSVLIWYGLVILLAAMALANGLELVNEFTNWFFLVLIPVGLLHITRSPGVSLRDMLRSTGITRTNLKDTIKLATLIIPLSMPLLYLVGEQQRTAIHLMFEAPLRALMAFLISFLLALFTAAFVEEFFFRGILQSRLAACLGSEWRGLWIASLLFGLLHLPMYFFSPFEPTHGNLLWSLTSVITEQAVLGVLFGLVWLKTHNLMGPVLIHAFINAVAMMAMLRIGTG